MQMAKAEAASSGYFRAMLSGQSRMAQPKTVIGVWCFRDPSLFYKLSFLCYDVLVHSHGLIAVTWGYAKCLR